MSSLNKAFQEMREGGAQKPNSLCVGGSAVYGLLRFSHNLGSFSEVLSTASERGGRFNLRALDASDAEERVLPWPARVSQDPRLSPGARGLVLWLGVL